jgi:Z1 domain
VEERHIKQIIQNLIDRFEYLGEGRFNLDNELKALVHPVTLTPIDNTVIKQIETSFLENVRYRRSHDGAILIPVSIVSDPREHEEWYDEWLEENNDLIGNYYWKRLEDHLSRELTLKHGPENAGVIVKSIDYATNCIMQRLANPKRREFSYKGLVVGYVQSGKTANFTALIAKAADAGYKLIIVLSGIHSILRRQTQIRLDQELTGMNDLGIDEAFIEEPADIKRWTRITTARLRERKTREGLVRVKDLGEFDTVNVDPFNSICNRTTPTIAIMKKNVKVLDKLIEYVADSTVNNRTKIPLLLIDDEADQASINTNYKDPDSDPTSTNERIRTLLSLVPQKAYIGYTATPFANVLIDMTTEDDNLQDDLYPRNFIVSLPKPDGYFGTSRIFQGNLTDSIVTEIPDESNELIGHGIMTVNLAKSVDQFILGCAVRNLRRDKNKPMSMLVHVSHRIGDMSTIKRIVETYITEIKGRYLNQEYSQTLRNRYQDIWDEYADHADRINRELGLNNFIPSFNEIWNEVQDVLKAVTVLELNSSSDDILDYATHEELKVIAVGGNQLSRGLTLEGLMISYYLRASKQYDTLLQMGRWFGYRQGYEDLTRIHTTDIIWESFEHLALVEEELRSEIYRYEEENLTPSQMAVRIKAHRNLKITAPNKMGAATVRQSSYSDSLNQTYQLPLNELKWLKENYQLGSTLISNIVNKHGFTNVNNSGVFLSNQKISGEQILRDFLNRYHFVPKESTGGPGLDSDRLLAYIFRRLNDPNPELTHWSVAVVGNAKPNVDGDPLNYGGIKINRIQRSRKHTEKGYNIGVLTEPDHLNIDLHSTKTRSPQNALLLLYLISKDSRAASKTERPVLGQRIDLFRFIDTERVDVLGLGIVLPKSEYEPSDYIGQ